MKRPLITILFAALLTPLFAPQEAFASDFWVHMKVRDHRGHGKLTLDVPAGVIRFVSAFLPRQATASASIDINGHQFDVPRLRRAWQLAKRQPEGKMFTFADHDDTVIIGHRGGSLVVNAHSDRGRTRDERVEVRIPGQVVDALLRGPGDRMNLAAGIQALAQAGSGELVAITSDRETVRIWVDRVEPR